MKRKFPLKPFDNDESPRIWRFSFTTTYDGNFDDCIKSWTSDSSDSQPLIYLTDPRLNLRKWVNDIRKIKILEQFQEEWK